MYSTISLRQLRRHRLALLVLSWGLALGAVQLQAQAQAAPQSAAPAGDGAPSAPTEGKVAPKSEGAPKAAPALVLSADGAYVLDAQNKLAWLRCVEGMTWNGHQCAGEASLMTYTTAQALAAARAKADGVAWRLPRIHELRRLQEDPANATLFPGDPREWTWSGNASINVAQTNPYNYDNIASGSTNRQERLSARLGWAVHLGNGESRGDVSRGTALVVRLVRPYQP
ncbi:DUF1566 domain-containing protein [Hylemonella sp. W303a]|uniref:Lcl domain-containing protein n=1 Tax=Hylemonella sp. W303a TaxID=3389873 RepID=UPI00396B326B